MLVLCGCDCREMRLIFLWGLEACYEGNSQRGVPKMFDQCQDP